MTLLNPQFLWGLLGISVPVAIHLWSKRKVRTIKVGSIQFISETKSKQNKNIAINEWWLLLLRCLLIGLLVFILTEPRWTGATDSSTTTYIFEPSLLTTSEDVQRFDDIPLENRRLLKTGLPAWSENEILETSEITPQYWQLAQEIQELPADSIIVFTKALQKGIRGKRPEISPRIRWVSVSDNLKTAEVVAAKFVGDSIQLVTFNSTESIYAFAKAYSEKSNLGDQLNASEDSLSIETENGTKQIFISQNEAINVQIVADENVDDQRVFVEAAFRAIATYINRPIAVEVQEPDTFTNSAKDEYVVWLSETSLPVMNQKVLVYKKDIFAEDIIALSSQSTMSFITQKLTASTIEQLRFVEQLLGWLAIETTLEQEAARLDQRSMDFAQFSPKEIVEDKRNQKVAVASFDRLLWVVLVILLLGERTLARIRKQ